MKRKKIDAIKTEVARLLQRIDELERLAGWARYEKFGSAATSKPHPEDLLGRFISY